MDHVELQISSKLLSLLCQEPDVEFMVELVASVDVDPAPVLAN